MARMRWQLCSCGHQATKNGPPELLQTRQNSGESPLSKALCFYSSQIVPMCTHVVFSGQYSHSCEQFRIFPAIGHLSKSCIPQK